MFREPTEPVSKFRKRSVSLFGANAPSILVLNSTSTGSATSTLRLRETEVITCKK
ncbi:hypothetical protein LBBP_01908 [Leptospira borgpetersenii serovar Ballum]|uniref:Uncharacterized protein n=1 Tax=Leptospira borgpetersenii serovar Ballum TaxID=280505 RepID=A0A0S2IRB0_LEPBO|nr:hypothetical protein LBBP_01908 [Leptospira borgpetersenii serovar Ballum]